MAEAKKRAMGGSSLYTSEDKIIAFARKPWQRGQSQRWIMIRLSVAVYGKNILSDYVQVGTFKSVY